MRVSGFSFLTLLLCPFGPLPKEEGDNKPPKGAKPPPPACPTARLRPKGLADPTLRAGPPRWLRPLASGPRVVALLRVGRAAPDPRLRPLHAFACGLPLPADQ